EDLNLVPAVQELHDRAVEPAAEVNAAVGGNCDLGEHHDGAGKGGVGATVTRVNRAQRGSLLAEPQLAGWLGSRGEKQVFGTRGGSNGAREQGSQQYADETTG